MQELDIPQGRSSRRLRTYPDRLSQARLKELVFSRSQAFASWLSRFVETTYSKPVSSAGQGGRTWSYQREREDAAVLLSCKPAHLYPVGTLPNAHDFSLPGSQSVVILRFFDSVRSLAVVKLWLFDSEVFRMVNIGCGRPHTKQSAREQCNCWKTYGEAEC